MADQKPSEAVLSIMSKKLRCIYTYIRKELETEGISGIDISHGDILYALMSSGPQPMSVISRRIDRDKSTVTSLVAKLERLDLIERDPDPGDKRSSIIALTKQGRSLIPVFNKISERALKRFWKNVSREEQDLFMDVLNRTVE